ncbi:interleukin-1 receptor type 1-like isoform X2 [Rhineura floridana]|uniref:interleukin-1 receptor type 1-like isoform X2 n=1 Tax=Rhineura floridana TaxID=261503 RepID=UPI002AC816EB|nr:interleukin-1 receptor type 1-like isoform X2 [Rhineura floridana]
MVVYSPLSPEKCIVQNNPEKVEEGPLGLDCFLYMSLNLESTNYSLSWYIDGSETPVTKQPSSQIHQRGNMLWFLPARYQDSGLYECIISYRNSTRCYKNIFKISVVNNSALCFNENLFYIQSIPKASNAKIVCSDMEYFGKELDRSSIQWYKECKPVLSERFFTWETELIIKKVREDDKGKYQCKTEYTYLGNQYNVSRSIFVDVTVNPPKKQTEIMYPTNNTIEAELGSKLLIECNVSSYRNTLNDISWKVNNTHVDSLFKPRIEEGIQKEFPAGEAILYVVPLNITELKSEDYGQRFVCHAGEVAAYVSIQRPTKNVLGLIALILLIIIPVLICVLFKIEIVLWYRKSCHPFLHKKVSDGKIYDAYVLYPKTDTQDCFALKVLPEVLEKKCGYKLFILGRDDLPGKAVVNVIDETIKQSRRLIMILVPGFSSYNLLEEVPEEQLALYNALMNESAGMKVILIEMGKIKDYSNMPESIRYIKQKQGIIRWEGDFTSKRSYSTNTKFWKKVQYRMPPGHQISPELPLVPTSLNTCQATET